MRRSRWRSNALEAEDAGNLITAAELYRAVLANAPDFGPAKRNLQRLEKSAE